MIPLGASRPRGTPWRARTCAPCQRCHVGYDFRRSTSRWLKPTYCGTLCEQGALGFTIEALLENVVAVAPVEIVEPIDLELRAA